GDALHALLAERQEAEHAGQDAATNSQQPAGRDIARGQAGLAWQPIRLRLVDKQVERIQPADGVGVPVTWLAIDVGATFAALAELLDALLRASTQIGDGPELNRRGRTCLRAGRSQSGLEPVVTQRALHRGVIGVIYADDVERTRGDAIATSIAHVRLDNDGIE